MAVEGTSYVMLSLTDLRTEIKTSAGTAVAAERFSSTCLPVCFSGPPRTLRCWRNIVGTLPTVRNTDRGYACQTPLHSALALTHIKRHDIDRCVMATVAGPVLGNRLIDCPVVCRVER